MAIGETHLWQKQKLKISCQTLFKMTYSTVQYGTYMTVYDHKNFPIANFNFFHKKILVLVITDHPKHCRYGLAFSQL